MKEIKRSTLGGVQLSQRLNDKDTDFLSVPQVTQEKCVCLSCPGFCQCGFPVCIHCEQFLEWRRKAL